MRKFMNWKQAIPSLIIVAVLLISMAGGAAYAKYVMDTELKGNVTITANLGSIELWEHEAVRQPDGSYELNLDAKVKSNSYTIIPGLDIPKDPFVTITDKSPIPVYVYLKVDTNIVSDINGISYTLNTCWEPVAGCDGVYVYYDRANNEPFEVTSDIEIPILVQDGEGNGIIVSQHLKTATDASGNKIYPDGGVYLNFYASMYQVASGTDAVSVYTNNNQTNP